MKPRFLISMLLLAGFAIAAGDFAFRIWNPAFESEYMVEGVVRPFLLQTGETPKKHLYLRNKLRLTQPPEQAWIQLIGHEVLEVFVNGRRVGRSTLVGKDRLSGLIIDVTPYLHGGENSIAVHVPQIVLDRPPAVAIDGKCEFADGSSRSLADPKEWKASDIYDHRGAFWYETEFNDDHWSPPAQGEPVYWRAQVEVPPRGISQPRNSQWIIPAKADSGAAVMARSFDVPGEPREGWLRVMSNGSYRVAVNGYLLTHEQNGLGINQPEIASESSVDISPLLRSGRNTISILAETPGEAPRIRADLEATTLYDARTYVATDEHWKSLPGYPPGWTDPDLETTDWKACKPEIGYLGVNPRKMERELITLMPPGAFWMARDARYAAWIVGSALIAGVGAAFVGWLLTKMRPGDSKLAAAMPYLALLPSTIAAATGGLMTWDLAFTAHDVYKPIWLMAIWLLVLAQWLLLVVINTGRAAVATMTAPQTSGQRLKRSAIAAGWIALTALAFWLRMRDIKAEQIHHDEVSAYAFTQAIFEYGFPGGQVHPDIPFGYCATSELCYYFHALCALFTDDPLLVLRIPTVLFSMATLFLVSYIAWKWFDGYVAVVAGVLYAVSPHIIAMSDFGRYLSQVQFFTLLAMWLTYEAVRGTGPPNVRLMWGATLAVIGMYLSWEGTGMFLVGLALAVFLHRRRHLKPLLASPHLYICSAVILLTIVAQDSHRIMQQTERLWYGEGISSLTVKPMWRYPFFQHDYFLINAVWIKDGLLPMAALAIALIMSLRHRWRFPLRFTLVCFIMNCEIMAAVLPVRTNRYSYHLTPMFILITAAVAVASAEALLGALRASRLPNAYRWYAKAVAAGAVGVAVVLMSGWTVVMSEMTDYASTSIGQKQLRIPDWEEPMNYMLKNLKKGDVVISIFPHTTNYMFAVEQIGKSNDPPRTVDYWVQSRLILQATMGDTTLVPRDRRSGAVMLYNLEQVEKLFNEHDRVWYLTMRMAQSKINDSVVSKYLREHMDVVSEDFATALMVHDKNNRPATVRLEEEDAGQLATDYYLR